jgi:F-type H+-transporting ATPase subunit b
VTLKPGRQGRVWMPVMIGIIVLVFGVGVAGAAETVHYGASLFIDFLYRCLNFALLVGLLGYFFRKPLGKALADRREKLVANLRDARQARDEAEARAARLASQLEAGSQEIEQLRRQLAEGTTREQEQLLEQARQSAAAILREAGQQATREVERARHELQAEAAALAIELAEKRLAAGLTAADQERLVDETLKQVGGRS